MQTIGFMFACIVTASEAKPEIARRMGKPVPAWEGHCTSQPKAALQSSPSDEVSSLKSLALLFLAVSQVAAFSPSHVGSRFLKGKSALGARRPAVFDNCASAVTMMMAGGDEDTVMLIEATKGFMAQGNGFYSEGDPDIFADDFCFAGEILFPQTKKNYLYNLNECFRLWEVFPDIQPNPSQFSIDPSNPRRVWFITRVTGTHNGTTLKLPIAPGISLPLEPTGSKIAGGPEAFSVTWDRNMKVKFLTVGYPINAQEGTNGGLGAAFGLLHGCGIDRGILKFVHDNIEPVLQINLALNRIDNSLPLARARPEDIPPWWFEYQKTGEIPA